MKSPFPGMDPYIERYWEGAHARLIGYIADALALQLPDDLAARIEERVYIDANDHPTAIRRPDVRVVEDPLPWQTRSTGGATATAGPVVLHLDVDPLTERYIVILDMDGNRIVTAIELLSPTNKTPGPGREQYLQKRQEFVASEANLVEKDLVRAGNWVKMLEPFRVPEPYRVGTWRSAKPAELGLYPITLRQPLPAIRIPLRPSDHDVELELQPLLDRDYQFSRFDRIDYAMPCEPPLAEEDAAWARQRIAERGS